MNNNLFHRHAQIIQSFFFIHICSCRLSQSEISFVGWICVYASCVAVFVWDWMKTPEVILIFHRAISMNLCARIILWWEIHTFIGMIDWCRIKSVALKGHFVKTQPINQLISWNLCDIAFHNSQNTITFFSKPLALSKLKNLHEKRWGHWFVRMQKMQSFIDLGARIVYWRWTCVVINQHHVQLQQT